MRKLSLITNGIFSETMSILLLLPLLLPFSSSFMIMEENPMQQLSQAELSHLAGYGDERLSSVLVTGSLICEACLQAGSQLITSPIKGAKVAVACRTEAGLRRRRNCGNATTDEYGEFIIDLPSQLHATPRLEQACVVRVLRMPRTSLCRRLSGLNPRRIKLSSVGNSIRVYTAGVVAASLSGTLSQQCATKSADAVSGLRSSSW